MLEPISYSNPSFTGYQHPLKTLFKQGENAFCEVWDLWDTY